MGAFPFLVGGRDRTSRSYVLGHVVPPQATDRFDRVAMTVRCDYLLAMQTGQSGSIEIRVRYAECDPMGVAHHSAYAPWFEMGRTELLRTTGGNYRDLESAGILLAVVKLAIRYKKPARYDDVLSLTTRIANLGHVKIEHEYELHRGEELLATAETTLACIDREGRAQPLPESLTTPSR